jgi:hypothetical protein
MPCAASTVSLGGVTFDLDPDTYTPLIPNRRGSVHQIVDEEAVFQDLGIKKSDMQLTLSGKLSDVDTLIALWALYCAAAGTQHTFIDYLDNTFTVVFAPGDSFTVEKITGSGIGYEYTMVLNVVSITSFFGGADPF